MCTGPHLFVIANYSDVNTSAVKGIKGFDPLQPGSPDVFGVSLTQLGAQQSGALNRTEMLGGATSSGCLEGLLRNYRTMRKAV